jgi:hypothetical protein
MSKMIELVGAPGAGKSTLARELVGRRLGRSRHRVVSATALLRRPSRRLPASLAPLVRRPLDAVDRREALTRMAPDWQDFLDLCADSSANGPSIDALRMLYSSSWLLTTLELTALARERSSVAPEVILLEEGLVQRALAVLGPEPAAGHLSRFVATVPSADVVVHLTVPHELLIERVQYRASVGRVIPRHAGLRPDELAASLRADVALLQQVTSGLRQRGVTVVEASAEDVDATVTRLERALAEH